MAASSGAWAERVGRVEDLGEQVHVPDAAQEGAGTAQGPPDGLVDVVLLGERLVQVAAMWSRAAQVRRAIDFVSSAATGTNTRDLTGGGQIGELVLENLTHQR